MKIFNYHPNTGLLLGESKADESPLEPGVWLIPANATTEQPLQAQDGKTINFVNSAWVYQDIPTSEPEPAPFVPTYKEKRTPEYPAYTDYLDGVVKGDQAQIDKYIADCLAVKAKYPKE
jgi:hypothetical protein